VIYTWQLNTWQHDQKGNICAQNFIDFPSSSRLDSQTYFKVPLYFFLRLTRDTESETGDLRIRALSTHRERERERERERWSVAPLLPRPFARSATKISSPLLKISKPSPSAAMSSTSSGFSLSLSLSLYINTHTDAYIHINMYMCVQ
jgi:hypothetical protein